MATIIKLKRGTTTPTTSNLANGEVGIDTSAKKFYINDSGTIKEIGGAAAASSIDSLDNGSYSITLGSDGVLTLRSVGYVYDSSQTYTTTTAGQTLDSFDTTDYRGVKYLINATSDSGEVHAATLLLTHNDTTVYTSVSDEVYSTSSLFTLSGSISGTTVTITVTPAESGMTIDFVRTSLISRAVSYSFNRDLQTSNDPTRDLQNVTAIAVDMNV